MIWEYKDLKLYYEIQGEGIPIFMLHGYFVDHHIMSGAFESVFAQLKSENEDKNFKRIYLDLPGMGQSSSASWITNADVMIDILMQFIKDISPNEKFILAGESYGGYLLRGLLKKLADRVLGSVFLCPCIIPDFSKRTLPLAAPIEIADMTAYQNEKQYEDFKESMIVQSPYTYQRYKEDVLSGVENADETFLEHFQAMGYACAEDVDDVEKPYGFETLFLVGKQDDCVGYQDAFDILQNYQNANFLLLNHAGHNLQIDQEESFTVSVKQYLKKVSK